MTKKIAADLSADDHFNMALTSQEKRLIARFKRPNQIQHFLDSLAYASETIYRSPLTVLHERTCQCFDGAVFAAAMLHRLGYQALILNLLPNRRDDDHVLALFRHDSHWGAVAKSNFSGLRFREPVYRDLRELVMSYFEHYYNLQREKTLRGYTRPLDLKAFDHCAWMTRDETMHRIGEKLDKGPRYGIMTRAMVRRLSLIDDRACLAGLHGANEAGLSTPPRRKN